MIDDGLNYRVVNGQIIWPTHQGAVNNRGQYTKEETLRSFDAGIVLFEKHVAEIQRAIDLLKKYRAETEQLP